MFQQGPKTKYDHAEILKLVAEGKTAREVSKQVGCSVGLIAWVTSVGRNSGPGRIRLWWLKLDDGELRDMLKISRLRIKTLIKRHEELKAELERRRSVDEGILTVYHDDVKTRAGE